MDDSSSFIEFLFSSEVVDGVWPGDDAAEEEEAEESVPNTLNVETALLKLKEKVDDVATSSFSCSSSSSLSLRMSLAEGGARLKTSKAGLLGVYARLSVSGVSPNPQPTRQRQIPQVEGERAVPRRSGMCMSAPAASRT